MAARKGRSIIVKINGAAVAGLRSKSITINGSPIDVTNDDDDGVRKLLDEPGQVEVNISGTGIATSAATMALLRALALSRSDRVVPMQFLFGSGSPDNGYSGQFFIANLTEGGEHTEAGTFGIEFQSADEVTYA